MFVLVLFPTKEGAAGSQKDPKDPPAPARRMGSPEYTVPSKEGAEV